MATGNSPDLLAVRDAVRNTAAVAGNSRFVLAVSGGRDSMAMLHAFAEVAPDAIAAVATFDHGTGVHATDAVRLVAETCVSHGIRAVSGRAGATARTEAAWREARWRFLREVASGEEAIVATAHTRDDNVETVLMRVMRGSGARGLAALFAPSDAVRPFLALTRDEVARYAEGVGVRWVEDPSNASRAHLRNRVRHEILPALMRVRPSLDAELLEIARRAASIRAAFDEVALRIAHEGDDGSLSVATASLADYDPEALCALWPAIAARGGIVLDARGTVGLARFTNRSRTGDRLQLSGGIDVLRRREEIVLRARRVAAPEAAILDAALDWGRWRFARCDGVVERPSSGSAWVAALPRADRLVVRAWREGDRMHGAGDAVPRRVKRFLRDAGLVGPERDGWPVVVCGEDVVWIPGVRRSSAAAVRSGRPEVVYVCERTER